MVIPSVVLGRHSGATGPAGTTDHAALTNLDFASANHTGFAGTSVSNDWEAPQDQPSSNTNLGWGVGGFYWMGQRETGVDGAGTVPGLYYDTTAGQFVYSLDGSTWNPLPGGNPFDQSLNTTDFPSFTAAVLGNIRYYGQISLSNDGDPIDGPGIYWEVDVGAFRAFFNSGGWQYLGSGGSGTSGYSGISGFSGFSGKSGYSGISGFSGYSGLGTSGFSGYSGTNGSAGSTGTSGFSGYSGISGISGFSGYSGVSGFSGKSGYSGVSGFSGYSGNGQSGFSGYSGLGTSGFSGYSGTNGSAGSTGTSGFSGYSGISGISGFSGYSGVSGFSGKSGYSGVSGFSGYSGNGQSGFSGYSGGGTSGFSGYSGKTPNPRVEVFSSLTDASTIATDASTSSYFTVTLGGNRTLGNPTNAVEGQIIRWAIVQDGSGSRTITLDTKFVAGLYIITASTGASKTDYLTAIYRSGADKFHVIGFASGY